MLKKIKKICIKQKRKFFISNNIKVAKNLNLDGVYIPSFNRLCNFKNQNIKTNFKILGSAHNLIELKTKENQSCNEVFIAPIFKNEKSSSFLNVLKFNLIAKHSSEKIIALGGINRFNICKLKMVKCEGFAAINFIKKNRPKKIGRFL